MCSAPNRQFRDVLILHSSENEDRNLRRCLNEPSERLYPADVRQRKVHQNCRDTVRIAPILRSFFCQRFKTRGAMSDPYHSE